MLSAPRLGERVTVTISGDVADGIVTAVTWQLQGIERQGPDLSIEGEPLGSVSLVHVMCRPLGEAARQAQEYDDLKQGSGVSH
jgi:hypothetical protein